MESITIKVERGLAKEIEFAMNPYYSTKTEFIREALRDKIKQIKKEKVLQALKENFGKSKVKTPLEDDEKIREEVGRKYAKKFGIKLD